MTTLIVAVLAASLLGSLHCAGMCGPFVAFAVGTGSGSHRWGLHLAYHGGRLVTYTLLGMAAGAAGALLNLTAALAGLQPIALAIAGGFMIAFGLVAFAQQCGATWLHAKPPRWLALLVQRVNRFASQRTPLARALLIGLASTLLPCGWLYAFAVTAAGTGGALAGGLVMAVFWVGTVPVLASLGVGLQSILGPLRARLPALTALALVVAGCSTLFGRHALDITSLANAAAAETSEMKVPNASDLPPCCKEHSDEAKK